MAESSGRLLPELTENNEFFWKSGEDGTLRFQRCSACGELRHPPVAVCPYCQSNEWAPAAVSGRAVVAGFTINEHTWLPTFPPPYVIAIVAIEEDDRVRLTTNIVHCEPADVFVGMKVRVVFEHDEDVWIPLFEPTSETDKGPFPAVDETSRVARPMPKGAKKFEDEVAITGIGMSQVGRRLMVDPITLTVAAAKQAIADAGLEPSDIDGLSTYPGPGIGVGMSEGGITALEEVMRLRPLWINSGIELPGQGGSVTAAMLAVAGGLCNHVLCFRTVWEATYAAKERAAMNARASSGMLALQKSPRIGGDMQWRMPFGASSASNWIAMQASAHFDRFGTTKETLGWIALNARKNAARTPWAIYKEPLTMDDYLNARTITTPFGLYDCDVPCDGSVAIIVSRRDLAGDMRQPAVHLEAVGTAITERISWDQGTLDHEPLVQGPAAHLWTRTDLKPADVDMAQLYDGFSFNCLSWLEALGFCGWGEAKDFLDGGVNIALDGVLPLNTHGGQLSSGRLHGYGFIHEAVTQLRGQAGERQVVDGETAVVSTGGGAPGGVFLFTKAR
ncbi:MAG TPA: OB-fold domain-containing protein [Acidimicrobiia bacterium]|nr:OB-fold domain-containing protein [Acidimicrobiia bacterium]